MAKSFKGAGDRIAHFYPGLRFDLKLMKSDLEDGEYVVVALLNALAWMMLVLLLVAGLFAMQGKVSKEVLAKTFSSPEGMLDTVSRIRLALVPAIATFFVLSLAFFYYPRIAVRKIVESVDKDLVFALKDLLVQISSGVNLYNSMANISKAGYGKVSDEFKIAVQDISTGKSQDEALEKLAVRTESDFLKRTIWQVVSVLKTGASLRGALESLVQSMTQYQNAQVKNFIQELNLWILVYVIVGIAIPSLGATLLVVLSLFSGTSIQESTLITLMAVCLMGEFALIEYVKVKRPVLYG